MKIPMTIFNSNFGTMTTEDNKEIRFANVQVLSDFAQDGDKVGCQVGKVAVVQDNNFALSKRINVELAAKKGPIDVMATVGMAVSNGKSAFTLKDFDIVKA